MACPTCGHTMQNLGLSSVGRATFWCPRCGTLKVETRTSFSRWACDGSGEHAERVHEEVEAPKLVGRCAALVMATAGQPNQSLVAGDMARLHRLGILEAIHTPGDRPEGT